MQQESPIAAEARKQPSDHMDSLYGIKKLSKSKPLKRSVSPINLNIHSAALRYLHGESPITTPTPAAAAAAYSSPALIKYQGSNSSGTGSGSGRTALSPLSSVENYMKSPQSVYGTPVSVVVEEDVLVMDGILVAGGRVSRSDSGGSTSNSSSSSCSGNSGYKTEICRAWNDFGHCRFGSKCQFAHGKEELRPTCLPFKNKPEAHVGKSYNIGSCSYGPKYRFLAPAMSETAVATVQTTSIPSPEYANKNPAVANKPGHSGKNTTQSISPELSGKTPTFTKAGDFDESPIADLEAEDYRDLLVCFASLDNWSPQDDGIEVTLPSQTAKCTSREDVDAYISDVLHGATTRKRLPVFTDFCLE